MLNYYQILGLNTSATAAEIRRAYRILARRYHPDVNPEKASEDKFKLIAEAYSVLSEPEERRKYDAEFLNRTFSAFRSGARAYQAQQQSAQAEANRRYSRKMYEEMTRLKAEVAKHAAQPPKAAAGKVLRQTAAGISTFLGRGKEKWASHAASLVKALSGLFPGTKRPPQVSILEISISMRDAVLGVRKTVEIDGQEPPRKVSIKIPPGVRTGSILRMRQKENAKEELVFVVKVAAHPFLNLQAKGLVAEIPVSIGEAVNGATISVPTLEEPATLTIPPGSQNGSELRLKERGLVLPDGSRGDLFYRLAVRVPVCHQAVGIKEKSASLDPYYESSLRGSYPKNLLEDYA